MKENDERKRKKEVSDNEKMKKLIETEKKPSVREEK